MIDLLTVDTDYFRAREYQLSLLLSCVLLRALVAAHVSAWG